VGGPDDGGVDVQSVADELHAGLRVEGRADDPRVPVEEGVHPVIQMCCVAGPGGESGHGGVVVRRGVPQGDGADLGDLPDEGQRPLLLAGHGGQLRGH